MEIYTVCFFGHRELHDLHRIEERLEPMIRELVEKMSYVVFLIGRHGAFDEYVASVIKRIQRIIGKENSSMTLVLPYAVADLAYYEEYYDSVVIPECVEKAHPKSAIALKNQWMTEQADLVIVNVERNKGGAYKAMKYAMRLNKKIVNSQSKCNSSTRGCI